MDRDATASLEELETEFRELAVQVDIASARRVVLAGLIEKRKAEAIAAASIRNMPALQKEALRKVLSEDERNGGRP